MLVFTKGSTKTYITEDKLVSKFPMRKRVLVRESISDLIKNRLLNKHPKEKKYRLTEEGKTMASQILHKGAKLWYMK